MTTIASIEAMDMHGESKVVHEHACNEVLVCALVGGNIEASQAEAEVIVW